MLLPPLLATAEAAASGSSSRIQYTEAVAATAKMAVVDVVSLVD